MSYMHIENLYKNKDILMFKKCYAMEKIHGTSSHIQINNNKIEKLENAIVVNIIVLRPLIELKKNNGERIISKYKGEKFSETNKTRDAKITPDKLEVLKNAQAIADEWVTPMRLTHVLDGFKDYGMEQTGDIIKAMLEDIKREAAGEIELTPEANKKIGAKTAILFKSMLINKMKGIDDEKTK